jgi:amino acid adenylation domain-containing protein
MEQDSLHNLEIPGLSITPFEVDTGMVSLDLAMSAERSPSGIEGRVHYSLDLFDAGMIHNLIASWQSVTAAGVESPDAPARTLSLLPPSMLRQVVEGWNRTDKEFDSGLCLHELVGSQARRSPNREAVRYCDEFLTYAELDARSDALAWRLQQSGIGPEDVVGVLMQRQLELPLALLAVLKAGAAYLPLDPELPRQRLEFMAADLRLKCVITTPDLCERMAPVETVIQVNSTIPSNRDLVPGKSAKPDNAAYVLYTSGSTGAPKATVNAHTGIVNRMQWMQSAYHLDETDRVLQKTPFTFDVSVWEFFWPLITGACLVVAPPGVHRNPEQLADTIASQAITTIHFVPSLLHMFLETRGIDRCSTLKRVFSSGEALSRNLQSRFFAQSGADLYNLYGPTEAAVDVTHRKCDRNGIAPIVPIGFPIDNTRTYILGPGSEPLPPGAIGELHIGGVAVGRGYIGRSDLTALRFVPDPFSTKPGGRLYRTGDLARFCENGEIEFLGRLDDQIKIRGVRVEPAEIEAVLERDPSIQRAIVTIAGEHESDVRLVAYLVPRDEASIDAAAIRRRARQSLPESMIPVAFVSIPEFPLTSSGKIDKMRLPPPPLTADAAPSAPPRDEIELRLIAICEELLGVQAVGVNDDFFLLGGHSMLAARLLAAVEQECGQAISLPEFFSDPTIESVAALLRQGRSREQRVVLPMQRKGNKPPLFLVHPASGNVLCYYDLARELGVGQPVYGLQASNREEGEIVDLYTMAARYIQEVRKTQPEGPYHLGGWSLGGAIAFEMAAQLARAGADVAPVLLIDCSAATEPATEELGDDDALLLEALAAEGLPLHPEAVTGEIPDGLFAQALALAQREGRLPPGTTLADFHRQFDLYRHNLIAGRNYVPQPGPMELVLFRTPALDLPPDRGWSRVTPRHLRVIDIPGDHYTVVRPPHVAALAREIRAVLDNEEKSDEAKEMQYQPVSCGV